MSTFTNLFTPILTASMSIYCISSAVKTFRQRKFLEKSITQGADIHRVNSDGDYICLEGTVKFFKEELTAPFSQRKCCAYFHKIFLRGGRSESVVGIETQCKDFLLETDQGVFLVKTNNITKLDDINLSNDLISAIKFSEQSTLTTAQQSNDLQDKPGFFKNKSYRFFEYLLQEGNIISVRGIFNSGKNAFAGALTGDDKNQPLLIAYGQESKIKNSYLKRVIYQFSAGILLLIVTIFTTPFIFSWLKSNLN